MAFKSIMLEVVADCPTCGASMPFGGVADSVVCPKCGHREPSPPHFWERVLSDVVAEAISFPEGKGRTGVVRSTPMVRLVYGRMAPRCAKCREALPARGLAEAAAEGASQMFCPYCGHPASVRPSPPWFSGVHPAAVALVNEADAAREGDKAEPQPFHCFSCGGLVPADPLGLPTRCETCGERVSMPGGVKRRLGTAATPRTRFHALIDMRDAVAVAPHSARHVSDFGIEPYGRLILAWHGEARRHVDPRPRLSLIDHRGLVLWQNEEIEFSDATQIHACPLSGNVLVVDAAGSIRQVDPKDGRVVLTIASEPGSQHRVDVTDNEGFQVDADGTMLVLRKWGSGPLRLRRFDPQGDRVPLWQDGSIEEEESATATIDWETMPHRPSATLPDASFVTGWDGQLYFVDRKSRRMARFDRAGVCAGVLQLDPTLFREVKSVGVDAQGTMVVLFTHARPYRGAVYDHIARIRPSEAPVVTLGPLSPDPPFETPPELGRLKLMPDGTVYLGGRLEQLRIISAEGKLLWESRRAAEQKRRMTDGVARAASLWGVGRSSNRPR